MKEATGELNMTVITLVAIFRDFPRGPVAKTSPSQCRGPTFVSWSGN